ncbi:cobalt ABC transporter permease [Fuscovulum blasticum]|uniref:cobalt ABC transporter permease n=1 Tax=Fuscovulum blasticum TaxID=1075 RepID=UPI000D3E2E15|nr:cobalt ABC transporter permease [Fuscovulum blasticum]AWD23162.1 cobalt ABC transporter permease [Fuscovulum blasticum]
MKQAGSLATAALCLMLAPWPALAHKVIASVYPAGRAIEGEIGFSNGDMAANSKVTVTDPAGRPLGETTTDEGGVFLFTPTEPVDHVFRADLGAGHVAEVTMSAADVGGILGKATPAAATAAPDAVPAPAAASPGGAAANGPALDEAAMARIVRDEMRPLRQEIAAYKEKNDLQSILGGIGYIAGLFGIGFYVAARRRPMAR